MDIQYIFVGIIGVIVMVYYYSDSVFAFARRGENYLTTLIVEPERVGNDYAVTRALQNNQLPRLIQFILMESQLRTILVFSAIINAIGFYLPPTTLINHWYGWVFLLLLTIININVIVVFINLYKNKHIVSLLCNNYYNLELAYEQEKKSYVSLIDAINHAFTDLEKDIDETKEAIEKNDKNDGDEQC